MLFLEAGHAATAFDRAKYNRCMLTKNDGSLYRPHYDTWERRVCGPDLFEVGEVIGRGTHGEVRAARCTETGRPVAIKFVDAKEWRHYARQQECMEGTLRHAISPTLYCVYTVDERVALVMELIDGVDLQELILNRPKEENLKYLPSLLRDVGGLMCLLHQNNMVYRDVKPANIMVPKDGVTLRLIDFAFAGYANELADPVSTTGFMPPELVRAALGSFMAQTRISWSGFQSSDLYGLGAVAFELIEGKPLVPDGIHHHDRAKLMVTGFPREHFKDLQYRDLYSGLLAPAVEDRWNWQHLQAWINNNPNLLAQQVP